MFMSGLDYYRQRAQEQSELFRQAEPFQESAIGDPPFPPPSSLPQRKVQSAVRLRVREQWDGYPRGAPANADLKSARRFMVRAVLRDAN